MFLFYCVGNEQYMDLWKTKFGMEVKKSASSSAAGRASTVTTARMSTVQGPVSTTSRNLIVVHCFWIPLISYILNIFYMVRI